MAQFELVFSGQLVEGFTEQKAKENLAKLFKASPPQAEKMFSGKPVVLRNRLDDTTAKKYLALLRKHGAHCQIRDMGGVTAGSGASAASPEAKPATANPYASSEVSAPPPPQNSAVAQQAATAEPVPEGRLSLAGEKAEEILSNVQWDMAPTGSTLSDENEEIPSPTLDTSHLDLAPTGSDLGQAKKAPPPPPPDVSHLNLEPPK